MNKVCKMGLESIWVNSKGNVRMCGWTNYYIGNLVENTIEEIWNNDKAEEFRKSMLDGSYRYCNCSKCPYMANHNLSMVDYNVPEYPKYCNLSYEEQCNYICTSCRKERYIPSKEEIENYKKIEDEVSKFINRLDTLASNGVGELFTSNHIINLLSKFEPESQEVKIELESNGSLFNQKNWSRISNLGNNNLVVYITVHSFEEDTYQFLSGTTLPVQNVIDNLHFIKKLRKENVINHFEIATVVQERNFREMPEFVRKCLSEFNPDRIRIRFFESYGVDSRAIEWFYDVRNPYHPYYKEFVEIMKNPIFQHPKVWKWQGETLSEQRQHPYFKEHINYIILSQLMKIDDFGKKFLQYMSIQEIRHFALYGNGGVGQAFATLLDREGVEFNAIFDSKANDCMFRNHVVQFPSKDNVSEYDAIIITSSIHLKEIESILLEMEYTGQIIDISKLTEEISCCCQ